MDGICSIVIATSLRASENEVMSVSSTSTFRPAIANCSATASERSGTSEHSTTGSAAVWTNITVRERAPDWSSVSRK